jgi:hypothetical protein
MYCLHVKEYPYSHISHNCVDSVDYLLLVTLAVT